MSLHNVQETKTFTTGLAYYILNTSSNTPCSSFFIQAYIIFCVSVYECLGCSSVLSGKSKGDMRTVFLRCECECAPSDSPSVWLGKDSVDRQRASLQYGSERDSSNWSKSRRCRNSRGIGASW